MAINQVITAIPSAGHRGVDIRDAFVTKQEAFQDALTATTVTQLNTFATQANALETNVNAKEASVVSLASTATTKATLATDYAEKMALEVEIGTYSSKEHAIGDLTATGGSAKAWATDTASPDGTSSKSAKTWANEALASATTAAAAVGTIPAGTMNDSIVGPTNTWSSEKIINTIASSGTTGIEVTSSVDITLISTSQSIQAVTMTAVNKSVILPNATTLTIGKTFIIKNTGDNSFYILDTTNNIKLNLLTGQIAILYCTNIATASGIWAIGDQSLGSNISLLFNGLVSSITTNGSNYIDVTTLSNTQAIIVYRGLSGYLEACVLGINGINVTIGAILIINAASSTYVSISELSSTQAIITYVDNVANILKACTLTVSGTTITAGAILSVSTNAPSYNSIKAISSTQAVASYFVPTIGTYAVVLTVTGTTITKGTILQVSGSLSVGGLDLVVMSPTSLLLCFTPGTSGIYAHMLTVSGTTITAGAQQTMGSASSSSSYLQMCKLSSTSVIAVLSGASQYLNVYILTIAGDVVTSTTLQVLNSEVTVYLSVIVTSSTSAVVMYSGASKLKHGYLKIDGNIISLKETIILNTDTLNAASMVLLDTNKFMSAYDTTTGILKAFTNGVVQ